MSENQQEFMQQFTEKCCKFFQDMYVLCTAYNRQFGGQLHQIPINTIINSSGSSKAVPQKKAKKLPKDPNQPKKPQSAYILYFTESYKKLKEKHPEINVIDISKKVGSDWNALGKEKQKPYLEIAQEKYAQYLIDIQKYADENPDKEVKIPNQNKKKVKAADKDQAKLIKQENLLNSEESESEEDEEDEQKVLKQVQKKVIQQESEEDEEVDEEESIEKPSKKSKKEKKKKHHKKNKRSRKSEDTDSFEQD